MKRVNLHSHTTRCGHATGTEEEYVLSAIRNDFEIIGFSDHTPMPIVNGLPVGGRMHPDALCEYIDCIQKLREKYKDQITIYIGLECDHLPWNAEFNKGLRPQVDYLIFGNHGDPCFPRLKNWVGGIGDAEDFRIYTDDSIAAMASGLYLYMAHPDMALFSMETVAPEVKAMCREICRAAKAYHVALEYNLSGLYKQAPANCQGYPNSAFWEIAAEENVTCVVGLDAHRAEAFEKTEDYDKGLAFLHSLGCKVLENPAELIGR